MSPKKSLASYKLQSVLEVVHRFRTSYIGNYKPCGQHYSHVAVTKLEHGHSIHRGLQLIASNCAVPRKMDATMVEDGKKKAPSPLPPPPKSNFSNWTKWLWGSILSLLFPLWRNKFEKMQRIEDEVEKIVEEVENAANVVEKLSEEIADKLPKNCKLEQAILLIEQVSKVVAKDAKFTEDFLHKVDELKQDMEDLDKMVEPIINKIVDTKSD